MVAWLDDASSGDPGRVHTEGRLARAHLEDARDNVAALLGTRPRQVVFTSGGTEAVNAAVWGAVQAHPGAPVVLAGVEHSSVRDSSARLAPVVELSVDRAGRIDPDAVDACPGRPGGCGGRRIGALPMGQPRGGHHPGGRVRWWNAVDATARGSMSTPAPRWGTSPSPSTTSAPISCR